MPSDPLQEKERKGGSKRTDEEDVTMVITTRFFNGLQFLADRSRRSTEKSALFAPLLLSFSCGRPQGTHMSRRPLIHGP